MKRIKKIIIGALLIFPFLIVSNARAITSEEVFKRILVNNFQYCYTNALVSELSPNSYVGKQSSYVTLFNEGFRDPVSAGDHGLVIPALDDNYNKIKHTANYDGPMNGARLISCNALIFGLNSFSAGSMSGLFDIYNTSPPKDNSNLDSVNSFMNGKLLYGIDTEETAEWEYCYNIYVKKQTTAAQEEKIGAYCRNEDSFPILSGAVVFSNENEGYKTTAYLEYPDIDSSYDITPSLHIDVTDTTNEKKCYDIEDEDHIKYRKCGASGSISVSKPTEGDTINLPADPEWKRDITIKITKQQSTGSTSRKIIYRKDNSKWKEDLAVITNNEYKDTYSFKDGDKYEFYMLYLSKYYKAGGVDIISDICQTEKPNILVDKENSKYYIWAKNKGWCLANLDTNKIKFSYNMTVFSTDEREWLNKLVKTPGELIELMGELNYDDSEQFPEPEPGPEDPEKPEEEPTCANSGGAGSLGWIVCPVMEWLGKAAKDAYTDLVEPSLNVPASLFSKNEDEGTKKAWDVFQNIANGLFIVLFLIVIFSQLTGVGIDNYGIKKILPKLILVAILVNLSYYICLICVDLSNIFGNGLKDLFDNLSTGAPTLSIPDSNLTGKSIGTTAITGVAVLAAMVGMVGAVWQNPAILLSLLVSALGVVIAIFFLFILLAAREAAIVALVVISPVAFVCYVLPNTKKLFDKWLSLGKGLLLVYPICGLLVGGGNYVSRLLLSSGFGTNGFIAAFTAMIVGIVPVFFIPTVLKGSFAAMGNIGAKISGFGEKMRGGATRGIRNAEGYKNAQKMGLERRTRLKAGLDKNGNLTARGERRARRANTAFGRFIGSDKRRAAYIAQAKKDIGTSEEAGAMLTGALARSGISQADALPDSGAGGELGPTFTAGTESAYYGGQFLDAASSGNITGMNSAINAMRASGMKAKDIAKLLRYAQNHGYYNNIDRNTRAAWMRDVSKKYGSDFLSTDFELNHFMTNGGSSNHGSLGGYGEYAGSKDSNVNIEDIKPEDVLKLSGDSLSGMISAGKIDQGMAQRVMAMNPNMSADKRIMLGALANGSVGAGVDVAQFKADASALASNRNAAVSSITPTGSDDLATLVSRWTAPTAQRTTIVQEFFGEEDRQIRPVDVSIAHGDAGTSGGTGGGASGTVTDGGVSQGDLMGVHDDFSGETHVNSGTGRVRTYDRMDMYPRMKGESSEAYGERLKMMREKEEEYLRNQGGNRS